MYGFVDVWIVYVYMNDYECIESSLTVMILTKSMVKFHTVNELQ